MSSKANTLSRQIPTSLRQLDSNSTKNQTYNIVGIQNLDRLKSNTQLIRTHKFRKKQNPEHYSSRVVQSLMSDPTLTAKREILSQMTEKYHKPELSKKFESSRFSAIENKKYSNLNPGNVDLPGNAFNINTMQDKLLATESYNLTNIRKTSNYPDLNLLNRNFFMKK